MVTPQLKELIEAISHKLGTAILSYNTVHGGDINHALRIETATNTYFCKYNTSVDHRGIIESEAAGLELLHDNGINIPCSISLIALTSQSGLLMDWIESVGLRPNSDDEKSLATQLCKLHQVNHTKYGGANDNFIGSLPQPNNWYDNITDYYYESRLLPQFKMAFDKGYLSDHKALKTIAINLGSLIPYEEPTLIHGDLWSGNYMISKDNLAYLIDPSVSYGHREMDIAMLHLFGQVPEGVMSLYNEQTPLIKGWQYRMDIFQLYYLLVHLNIFGRSYLAQVRKILSRYS